MDYESDLFDELFPDATFLEEGLGELAALNHSAAPSPNDFDDFSLFTDTFFDELRLPNRQPRGPSPDAPNPEADGFGGGADDPDGGGNPGGGVLGFLTSAGFDLGDHEDQHTSQARALGPFFLPVYAAAGFVSFLEGESFVGRNNLLEVGPYSSPPTPF